MPHALILLRELPYEPELMWTYETFDLCMDAAIRLGGTCLTLFELLKFNV